MANEQQSGGFFQGLGAGLQSAGEILSPQVYEKNAIERRDTLENVARTLQIRKAQRALSADDAFAKALGGMQPTSFKSSADVLDALKSVPLDVIAESPRAQSTLQMVGQMQAREAAQEQRKQQMQLQYDRLNQARELAEQRSQDARLSAEERARHNLMMEKLTGELGRMRAEATKMGLELRKQLADQSNERYKAGLLSTDEAQFMAKQAWTGDTSVFTNLGRGRQGAENIKMVRAAIMEEGKRQGKTPEDLAAKNAEFFGIKAGERTLGSRQANVDMAVNEAMNFVPLALEASEKLQRTNIKSVNDLMQYVQGKTSSPELRRLAGATNGLINIYARAINPQGASTISDKDHAREVLDKGFSDGDYKAAVDQLVKEMYAAKKSPGQVREELRSAITGKDGGKEDPLGLR